MSKKTEVPSNIEAVIAEYEHKKSAEMKERDQRDAEKRSVAIAQGLEIVRQRISELRSMSVVPEYLFEFDATLNSYDEDELVNISSNSGYYQNQLKSMALVFEIPGLATIQYRHENGWRSARVDRVFDDDGPDGVAFTFQGSHFGPSVEDALCEAKKVFDEYQRISASLEKNRAAMLELREEEKLERQLKEYAVEEEDRNLFDAFKNDEVAVFLLKAFLALRQERTAFENELQEASDSLWSTEERWERKAAELRRQAEHSERQANEERKRASDLENDLQDTEKKLKKTMQGL